MICERQALAILATWLIDATATATAAMLHMGFSGYFPSVCVLECVCWLVSIIWQHLAQNRNESLLLAAAVVLVVGSRKKPNGKREQMCPGLYPLPSWRPVIFYPVCLRMCQVAEKGGEGEGWGSKKNGKDMHFHGTSTELCILATPCHTMSWLVLLHPGCVNQNVK